MIPIVAHTAQIFRSLCSIALVDLQGQKNGQANAFPFNFMDLVENEAPKMCG
jgi:hypothetical protein